jgi:cyclopropane fatty-acyl-phospholipid synthase-like methyltransferase
MIRRLAFEFRYLLRQTPWDTGVSPPELMAFLDANPPGRSLDLGCGTGTNAMTMAGRGWEVTAIDFSLQAIRCARRRFKHAGMTATLALGDVATMSAAQGVYHLALDIGCLHGLTAERKSVYATNLKRHLAPGGTYLLYALLASPTSSADLGISREHVEALFADRFDLLSCQVGEDRTRPSAWFTMRA